MMAAVPPRRADEIHAPDVARYVQQFRAFLGQDRIDDARGRWDAIIADNNQFRLLVLRQKQPWLDAFAEVDRLTLNGARRMRTQAASRAVLLAAEAGQALERLLPTLPDELKSLMRNRLLDLTGRAHPVLMEWEAARFYLRHGFRVVWTDVNVAGPEFRCEREGLAFNVECKRITRGAKEMLDDRTALTLGNGVVRAMSERELAGEVRMETVLTNQAPPEADIVAAVSAALPDATEAADFSVDVVGLGQFRGTVRPLPRSAQSRLMSRVEEQLAQPAQGYRHFTATMPLGEANPRDTVVLAVSGPRRSPEEHRDHIDGVVRGAAEQLTDALPGVVMVEMEGIENAEVFRDVGVFQEIAYRAFAAYPSTAAVLWRGERHDEAILGGFVVRHNVFAVRNPACSFPGADMIPLLD